MSSIPTIGGKVSKAEVFSKLLHHLREAQSQAAVLSHLHKTEDSFGDDLKAQGWLAVSELISRLCLQITELAKRGFR